MSTWQGRGFVTVHKGCDSCQMHAAHTTCIIVPSALEPALVPIALASTPFHLETQYYPSLLNERGKQRALCHEVSYPSPSTAPSSTQPCVIETASCDNQDLRRAHGNQLILELRHISVIEEFGGFVRIEEMWR